MVQLSAVESANITLVQLRPLVAVFVGATSGIGEYTLLALARAHGENGKGLRVYLVGRNATSAKSIIAECQRLCPSGDFRFVQVDTLTLLRDTDECCKRITKMETADPFGGGEPRIDILCMSQGFVRFGAAEITPEGLEVSMSLLYYSRMRFILKLLPLLLISPLPSHILSIFGAGLEKGPGAHLHPTDLSLTKNPAAHYGFLNLRVHVVHMTTIFFEHLAQQNPGRLSLVHVYPGLVFTPAIKNPSYPWWFKTAVFLLGPIAKRTIAIKPEEIGKRVLFLATPRFPARQGAEIGSKQTGGGEVAVAMGSDGVKGGGAYSVNWDGETNDIERSYVKLREQGFERQVWEHTMKVFEVVGSGKRFEA
ncbi:hypothetical protein B0A55_00081 [Friedmanniomyces simplex]|uniref:Ketoreductase (KR) domain-containing protein n=1 Tax=Friedmanniomyces simplex TaxID=329884 RepID=A0A4U0Y092_9PEZI|nr:hypothetical protein B0A55_00081 [Friedmanniomyces simplex]